MYSINLNESQIINNIRRFADDIFDPSLNQSLDFSITDSESNQNDHLIRPLITDLNLQTNKKALKSKYAINYQSPYQANSKKANYQNKSAKSTGNVIRKKIFDIYQEDERLQNEKK